MKKAELVFIPSPGAGHLGSAVEMAKLLAARDDRISVTVLIMRLPFDSNSNIIPDPNSHRIRFIHLPSNHLGPKAIPIAFINSLIESYKPHVRNIVSKLKHPDSPPDSPRLAGLVLDMFCTTFVELGNEFGVPSYIFFTSSAGFLGLMFHMQTLHDDHNMNPSEFDNSDATLAMPALANPLPAKVLPTAILNKEWFPFVLGHTRKFRETKGIIVNTFVELESHAVDSLSDGTTPPVYPVGPILNLKESDGCNKSEDIVQWLDDQPESSVVFLCFGSRGSFGADQVREIACALEHCGHRFLWSLRRPPSKGSMELPGDYEDPLEVLPEGYLNRTAQIGRVIGWAPQVAVLAHPSVGGFVSHCGWNSTLESIWFGVPIATWPLYAEQQFNAFEMVIELGLGVEIKMDYRRDFSSGNDEVIVSSKEIERGIRCLMEQNSEIRKKVMEMSEKSRRALMEGGSSHSCLGRFIQDVIDNIA